MHQFKFASAFNLFNLVVEGNRQGDKTFFANIKRRCMASRPYLSIIRGTFQNY